MINVVKIGGNVIDDAEALKAFVADFAALPGPKVLVHGGGKEATRMAKALGIEAKMVNGRRITDAAMLDIVTMMYAGLINKRIVSLLQGAGCNAIGLSGADGHAIPARRRSPHPIDFGFVGDIDPADVNAELLSALLDDNLAPVFCAICYDGNGGLLNCNADSVASAVALGLARIASVRLTYCLEMPGVLADIDNPASVIPVILPADFEALTADGTISGGMMPKIENALKSAKQGIAEVRICRATDLNSQAGTIIKAE